MDPDIDCDDLFEAFLLGRVDNGECLRAINYLRSQGFTPRGIVVCLTAGAE